MQKIVDLETENCFGAFFRPPQYQALYVLYVDCQYTFSPFSFPSA